MREHIGEAARAPESETGTDAPGDGFIAIATEQIESAIERLRRRTNEATITLGSVAEEIEHPGGRGVREFDILHAMMNPNNTTRFGELLGKGAIRALNTYKVYTEWLRKAANKDGAMRTMTYSEFGRISGRNEAAVYTYFRSRYPELPALFGIAFISDYKARHSAPSPYHRPAKIKESVEPQTQTEELAEPEKMVEQMMRIAQALRPRETALFPRNLTVKKIAEHLHIMRNGKYAKITEEYLRAVIARLDPASKKMLRDHVSDL